MTVIARIGIRGAPVLLGDLLLSRPTSHAPAALALPMRLVQKSSTAGLSASTLAPKVVRICSNAAIAWAGRAHYAEKCVARLRTHVANDHLSERELSKFLRGAAESRIQIVGTASWDDDGRMPGYRKYAQLQLGDLSMPEINGFEHVALGGAPSARIAATTWLRGDSFDAAMIRDNSTDLAAFSMAGCLLAEEGRGSEAEPIRHGYGGGYEIAYWRKGKIELLDDALWVFAGIGASAASDAAFFSPTRILHTSYTAGRLRIVSLWIAAPPHSPGVVLDGYLTREFEIVSAATHLLQEFAPSQRRRATSDELDRLPRSSRWQGLFAPVWVDGVPAGTARYVSEHVEDDKPPGFRMEHVQGRLRLSVRFSILENLASQVTSRHKK